MKILKNKKGQSLVEYLLLTALLGIATMGIVRLMGHSIAGKFAQITDSIQGQSGDSVHFDSVNQGLYTQKDMSDFLNNSTNAHH